MQTHYSRQRLPSKAITVEETEEEVEMTVAHEVAHDPGFGGERLKSLGYA